MNEIRAFVGHSFKETDSELVGKFLKYFDQVANSHSSFSWEHAEPAEPKLLAEKVMSLLSDKNVFIGICTRQEYVVDSSSLTAAFFSYQLAPKTAFYWKTSDWIIQEIGLAKGKGLDLILLIESGLRDPGGLQGDVEYISFDRSSPEKSFGKILEMITALSPTRPSTAVTSSEMKLAPDEEPRSPQPSEGEEWWIPKPSWTSQRYHIAFMLTTERDKQDDAQAINTAYLATDDAAQDDNRNSWKAFCEFTRLKFARGGSLAGLRALAAAHPHSSGVLSYLASGFQIYQDYMESARTYEAAAKESHEDIERLRLLKDAAVAHVRAGAPDAASKIIDQMKTHLQTCGTGEGELLRTLRELAEIDKNDDTVIPLMERIVAIDPSDANARFLLAYEYSKIDNNELAIFHYMRIPPEERTSMTWNNLGVAFDHSELSAKSIDAYRKAEKMGETLAMSNLAEKLIKAGFLPEAQKECEAALKINNYHTNINNTLSRLSSIPESENEKVINILQKIKPVSDFYIKCGRAMSRAGAQEIAKYWRGPDCVLEVTMRGSEFVAVGSYERRNLLASAFAAARQPAAEHYQVEYRGTSLSGGVIKARVTRTRKGDTPAVNSLLGSRDNESSVIMMLTDDQNEIQVMETTKGASPRFYGLTREEQA